MSSDEFESYTPVRRKRRRRTPLKCQKNTFIGYGHQDGSQKALEDDNSECIGTQSLKVIELDKEFDVLKGDIKDGRNENDLQGHLSDGVPLVALEDEEDNKLLQSIPDDELCFKSDNGEFINTNSSSPKKESKLAVKLLSPKSVSPKRKWKGIQQKNLITNYLICPAKFKPKGLITNYFNNLKITNIRTCQTERPKLEASVPDNQVNLKMEANTHPEENSSRLEKTCPFYKLVENFAVDAFSYGLIQNVSVYFLTHFHYDHYRGLSRRFSGQIYCSSVTANLVAARIKLPKTNLTAVPLGESFRLGNYSVTYFDANHCPGSVVIFFEGKQNILHTGDFRAENFLQRHPFLLNKNIDVLYLDTTYLDPSYCFPSQSEVLEHVRSIVNNAMVIYGNILIVCGTYTIGKEKVFLAAAETLGSKIWAPKWKVQILRCLEDRYLEFLLTEDPNLARVHVLPMKQLNITELIKYVEGLKFRVNHVIALKPSGWEFSNKDLTQIQPRLIQNISFYGIPYSEHSSFTELKDFVEQLRPRKVIPTVNVGNQRSREKMMRYIKLWQQ